MQCLDKRELTYVYIVLITVLVILLILLGLVMIYIVYPYITNEQNAGHKGNDMIMLPVSASGSGRITALVFPIMNGKSLVSAQSGFFPSVTGFHPDGKISFK